MYRSMLRGYYKKALTYPFKSLVNRIKGRPKTVVIDIVSVCNLRCPLCSVPPDIARESTQKKHIDIDAYKKIIDSLAGFATDLSLVYSGEPLIHPKFGDIVGYTRERYFTNTITNATLMDDRRLSYIIDGLDYVQISYDGHSKKSFEAYRIGADFDKVKENIEKMMKARNASKVKLPLVTATFLINSFNETEVDAARSYLKGLGVDRFFAKPINLNVHRRSDGKGEEELVEWLPIENEVTLYDKIDEGLAFKDQKAPCSIWRSPVIRGDGEVLMCCHDLNNTVKIGNVIKEPFTRLWDTEGYLDIRNKAAARQHAMCKICGK
ncbi:MAG: radical SAM protein [Methylococcales bacterium]|nr:radical SAM protein [Methylococcales bacterium]